MLTSAISAKTTSTLAASRSIRLGCLFFFFHQRGLIKLLHTVTFHVPAPEGRNADASLFFSPSQGYHTLLAVFAVRCLPHHTFIQYIDHGVVQLTETFVSRLMTGTVPPLETLCPVTGRVNKTQQGKTTQEICLSDNLLNGSWQHECTVVREHGIGRTSL